MNTISRIQFLFSPKTEICPDLGLSSIGMGWLLTLPNCMRKVGSYWQMRSECYYLTVISKKGFGKRNSVIIPEILGWSRKESEIEEWSLRKEEIYRKLGRGWGIEIIPGIRAFLQDIMVHKFPQSSAPQLIVRILIWLLNNLVSESFCGAICSEDVNLNLIPRSS